jgi:hypothetical protein
MSPLHWARESKSTVREMSKPERMQTLGANVFNIAPVDGVGPDASSARHEDGETLTSGTPTQNQSVGSQSPINPLQQAGQILKIMKLLGFLSVSMSAIIWRDSMTASVKLCNFSTCSKDGSSVTTYRPASVKLCRHTKKWRKSW